ncbi:MAG: hypothetical protein EB059_03375 [Alphaproteobacteria bacterium]|nr:hypothetical protein [Alphaproteobacteria bacterium]
MTHYSSKRFASNAGIAIGPILFVVALLAVIGMAMSAGNNTVGSTIASDRVRADIKSQGNLIRSKILECNQYSFDRGDLTDKYPYSGPDGVSFGTTAQLVESLDCLAFVNQGTTLPNNNTNLWAGAHSATLPPPTQGFDKWMYVNAGSSGGRCIRIQPSAGNATSPGIKDGLASVSAAFSTQEVVYDPSSSSQRFILWITYPSGTVNAGCQS